MLYLFYPGHDNLCAALKLPHEFEAESALKLLYLSSVNLGKPHSEDSDSRIECGVHDGVRHFVGCTSVITSRVLKLNFLGLKGLDFRHFNLIQNRSGGHTPRVPHSASEKMTHHTRHVVGALRRLQDP